jgi:Leucine-rich repeat (LRR) protein
VEEADGSCWLDWAEDGLDSLLSGDPESVHFRFRQAVEGFCSGQARLKVLNLSRTQVLDLTPLAALTRLEWLDLSETPVIDLKPLASLEELGVLSVLGTKVTDLGPLGGLTKLTKLHLGRRAVVPDSEVESLKVKIPGLVIFR